MATWFEVLELSKYDPEKDIVIINLEVGKAPPRVVRKKIKATSVQIGPMLKERGFSFIIVPVYDNEPSVNIEVKEQGNTVSEILNSGVKLGLSEKGVGEVDGKTVEDRAIERLEEVCSEDSYERAMKTVD